MWYQLYKFMALVQFILRLSTTAVTQITDYEEGGKPDLQLICLEESRLPTFNWISRTSFTKYVNEEIILSLDRVAFAFTIQ